MPSSQRSQREQQRQQQRCRSNSCPPNSIRGGSAGPMPLEYYGINSGRYFPMSQVSASETRPFADAPAGTSRAGLYATFPGTGGAANSRTKKQKKGQRGITAAKKAKASPSKTKASLSKNKTSPSKNKTSPSKNKTSPSKKPDTGRKSPTRK